MKTELDSQIDELEYQLQDIKRQLAELRRTRPREEVGDYTLKDADGRDAPLASLFGTHSRLILVHNMGRDCAHCTMWADGFVGLVPHLASRAAFVVTSPDAPEAQKEFAQARGWNFPMCSAKGTSFVSDMGFDDEKQGLMPGVSIFARGRRRKNLSRRACGIRAGRQLLCGLALLRIAARGHRRLGAKAVLRTTEIIPHALKSNS